MTITPEEARTKWCPFARVIDNATSHSTPAVNRPAEEHFIQQHSRCLADGCMAWRWSYPLTQADPQYQQGYCGLAGAAG